MATFNLQGVSPVSFLAGGTVTANRLVEISAANTVTMTDAITDLPIGVATIGGSTGDLVTVQQFGKAKLTASAAISVGAQVMPTASGDGKVSTASGATARTVGVALTAAGDDGDIVEVQLLLAGNTAANS